MSRYPSGIRSFDDQPGSPFYDGWRCPVCQETELRTECSVDRCVNAHDGWVIACGSNVEGYAMLKYGFEIKNHKIYPDDFSLICKMLKGIYQVKDVTSSKTVCEDGLIPLSVKLTKITEAMKYGEQTA